MRFEPQDQPVRGRPEHPHFHRHHPEPGERGGPFADPRRGRGRAGGRRGGRVPRGDVRLAVLMLLAEEPMHGYQLMQEITDRTSGRWAPSPGAVYPTISQLEDEGLVTVTAESGRRLVTLTEAGRRHVEERRTTERDPFVDHRGPRDGVDLRNLFEQLHGATREIARSGTEAQRRAAAEILDSARRSLYLLLADGARAADAND